MLTRTATLKVLALKQDKQITYIKVAVQFSRSKALQVHKIFKPADLDRNTLLRNVKSIQLYVQTVQAWSKFEGSKH